MRVGYLYGALLCGGLLVTSLLTARQGAGSMMPMPDPPAAGDPYWAEHANDGTWLIVGCAGAAVFGVAGVVLVVAAFVDITRLTHGPRAG